MFEQAVARRGGWLVRSGADAPWGLTLKGQAATQAQQRSAAAKCSSRIDLGRAHPTRIGLPTCVNDLR